MKIYAISDLHLSNSCDKPMDIFGGHWEGYTEKIIDNWKSKVTDEDLVLIAGPPLSSKIPRTFPPKRQRS